MTNHTTNQMIKIEDLDKDQVHKCKYLCQDLNMEHETDQDVEREQK